MATLISSLKVGYPDFFSTLWKRMGEQGDFPSLSKTVHDLTRTMHDEDKSISDITGAILSDFTLTQKVIRLANSAMYAGIGGEITTVTRAAMVLGFDAISHLALSVRFVDKLSAGSQDSVTCRAEMIKALVAGDIARKIASRANLADSEEAVICALMHHLGRLLLVFYFPDEWSEIKKISVNKSRSENLATQDVIGLTLDDISQEVAKSWHLPKKISHSMTTQAAPGKTSIPGSPDWLKALANFSGEAATIVAFEGVEGNGLKKLASRFGDALLVSADSIIESVTRAVETANDLTILEAVEQQQGKPADSKKRLAEGVLEITKALVEGTSFGNTLNLVLETMYGGMGFNRVVAFLRDRDTFKAEIGFGTTMPEVLPRLVFPEAYAMDVFHLSLKNKADVFIEDVASSKTASSMPAWFTETLPDVRAFVLLPMTFNGHPIGLLYGDWRLGTMGTVEKEELLLMRSLRDHLMKLPNPKKF